MAGFKEKSAPRGGRQAKKETIRICSQTKQTTRRISSQKEKSNYSRMDLKKKAL